MDPVLFASFLAATLLIVVSPGPSVALASAQAVKHGQRAAVFAVAGDALGTVLHILIAVASLSALIGLAEILLPFLQIAGGVFILYLAWQSFAGSKSADGPSPKVSGHSSFLAGFFACVTNPKAIVFFIALFPGFISPEYPVGLQSLIYGAIFVALDAAFILGYAMMAMHLANRALSPRIDINKISAFGLFGVGALMVFKGAKAVGTLT